MELGQYQLQIFAGLMIIPGAAVVALLRDSFKGNHRIRELMLLLKTRRDDDDTLPTSPRSFVSAAAGEILTATDGATPPGTNRISLSLPVQPKGSRNRQI